MNRRCMILVAGAVLGLSPALRADGPQDNNVDSVRRIPEPGIEVPPAVQAELERGLAELGAAIDRLAKSRNAKIAGLLPDIRIYEKAVHDALTYREFFTPQELNKAKDLLKEGMSRAKLLEEEYAPWTMQKGLVVRGYESRID